MARPIPDIDLRTLSKLDSEAIKPKRNRSFADIAVHKPSRNLVLGTVSGWFTGIAVVKVGKIAAFGLGGGILLLHFACECGYVTVNWERVKEAAGSCQTLVDKLIAFVKNNSCYSVGFFGGFFFVGVSNKSPGPGTLPEDSEKTTPPTETIPEPYKPEENHFLDKPHYPPKLLPHSPKISPSSIPIPNPCVSVTTNKQTDIYPSYGSYLYSIPGYSAFQPVSSNSAIKPNPAILPLRDNKSAELIPYPTVLQNDSSVPEKINTDNKQVMDMKNEKPIDFEDNFTPKLSVVSTMSSDISKNDSKINITSLTQGSGATVTIPSQTKNKDVKKKTPERFSLKTSIPISKIDMKSMSTASEPLQSNVTKPTPQVPFNPAFHNPKTEPARVSIQSNVLIKNAVKEPDKLEVQKPVISPINSISTLINAAEAINKTDSQYWKTDTQLEVVNEIKDTPPNYTPQTIPTSTSLVVNTAEMNKANFQNKQSENSPYDQKNQILFIQNKNAANPKMLVTIQQQNPQVILQRTNFESKNLQAPSRLSNQTKKCKEDLMSESNAKVVALKRLHHENCDENDFENLITENQIYGNKIVVKEKSQGILQEQDLKTKNKTLQTETKNVVLQPNFLYLSNVQFPANLMMIKNNTKVGTNNDANKTSKLDKSTTDIGTVNNSESQNLKVTKSPNAVTKEFHMLKSNNNVLQTLSSKINNKTDLLLHTTNQKVIMNPQIVYQVPMIVDTDNKLNQSLRDYHNNINLNKKEHNKVVEQNKPNDKLYIACPYQVDSKHQPKIVITNLRPKMAKVDEVSSLDLYEKKKRMRRLKYLSKRETKDVFKAETKKTQEKDTDIKNVITPEDMGTEIYKEFSSNKSRIEQNISDSESDYGEEDLKEYNSIIQEYANPKENIHKKENFLANFRLGSHTLCKDIRMNLQEKSLQRDCVAIAYVSAGRLDKLCNENKLLPAVDKQVTELVVTGTVEEKENRIKTQRKLLFLSQLKLLQVSQQYKDGYEASWQEILKERKRRNSAGESPQTVFKKRKHPNSMVTQQLLRLTEIKKCVTENNNLIKRRLDSAEDNGESIHKIAEKSFSELNKLSKMANRSVKLLGGKDTKKRDLNPGFDSENIQKPYIRIEQPYRDYPNINIPNISKIISLKSSQEVSKLTTTPATSMDEPLNSAAGVTEMFAKDNGKSREVGCQIDTLSSWTGIEDMVKSYRQYDLARKKEINELEKRNTALRVEGAHITRLAGREAERARALLAERQHLSSEEASVRASLQRLCAAIETIKNYRWVDSL